MFSMFLYLIMDEISGINEKISSLGASNHLAKKGMQKGRNVILTSEHGNLNNWRYDCMQICYINMNNRPT